MGQNAYRHITGIVDPYASHGNKHLYELLARYRFKIILADRYGSEIQDLVVAARFHGIDRFQEYSVPSRRIGFPLESLNAYDRQNIPELGHLLDLPLSQQGPVCI